MTRGPATTDPSTRVWRARRRHNHIDAELSRTDRRWELSYRHNGRLMLVWQYDSQEEALADADRRLDSLIRAGWNAHW